MFALRRVWSRSSSLSRYLCTSAAPPRIQVSKSNFAKKARKIFFNEDESIANGEDKDEEVQMLDAPHNSQWRVETRSPEQMEQRWWHVDGRIKDAMWKLHSEKPEEWTVQKLSDEFGLHVPRVEAILKLKRIENEEWKPEELHHDMEECVESAIELYKLEARTTDLNEDSPDVQELYMAYEHIHAFQTASTEVTAAKLKLKEADDEDVKAVCQSKVDRAEKVRKQMFAKVRDHLRPELDEPIEDIEVVDTQKPKNPPFDLALVKPRVIPSEGAGSGKVIKKASFARDTEGQRKNRFKIVITDTSKTPDGSVKVTVRDTDASLRHATLNELERAVQIEKCVPRSQNVVYSK